MASCPKCGKTKIKSRKGVRRCKRCGPLSSSKDDQSTLSAEEALYISYCRAE